MRRAPIFREGERKREKGRQRENTYVQVSARVRVPRQGAATYRQLVPDHPLLLDGHDHFGGDLVALEPLYLQAFRGGPVRWPIGV